jgi:hypothetical protein
MRLVEDKYGKKWRERKGAPGQWVDEWKSERQTGQMATETRKRIKPEGHCMKPEENRERVLRIPDGEDPLGVESVGV